MIQQICHILYKPITVSVGDFDVKKSRIIKNYETETYYQISLFQ